LRRPEISIYGRHFGREALDPVSPRRVCAQTLIDRRVVRSLPCLYGARDPFLLIVHDPFAMLDEFVRLINEFRSLALHILSPFVRLGTHQISRFISLASDSIASAGTRQRCIEDPGG
jgi:hypothetical protein